MRTIAILVVLSALARPALAQRADSARPRETPPPPAPVRVNVEAQFRYQFSHVEAGTPAPADRNEGGFQVRRARIVLTGSVLDPRLTFRFRTAYDRATGTIAFDDAWVAWAFPHGWSLEMGQFKPQFLREDIVSGFTQLAAERSYANDYFTVDYTQGIELSKTGRRLHPSIAIHDGSYGANTDFHQDRTDIAIAGRLEWLPFGEFRQFTDYNGWPAAGRGLLIAGAVDWEKGESDTTHAIPRVLKYTVDASLKLPRVGLGAAWYAQQFSTDTLAGLPTNLRAASQWGLMVQASAFVVRDRVELFTRGEQVFFDGVYYRNAGEVSQTGSRNLTRSTMTVYAVGANWYVRQHATKFTADVQLVDGPVPVANTTSGFVRSDGNKQIAVRTQAQFRF